MPCLGEAVGTSQCQVKVYCCAFLMQLRRGANGAVFLPRSLTRYKLRHASMKSGDTVQGAHTCAIKTGATIRDLVQVTCRHGQVLQLVTELLQQSTYHLARRMDRHNALAALSNRASVWSTRWEVPFPLPPPSLDRTLAHLLLATAAGVASAAGGRCSFRSRELHASHVGRHARPSQHASSVSKSPDRALSAVAGQRTISLESQNVEK